MPNMEAAVQKSHLRQVAERAKQEIDAIRNAEWVDVTISAASWTENTDVTGFGYAADVAFSGVAAKDSAESLLIAESIAQAQDCGLCAVCNVMDGKIRYYAQTIPAADMMLKVRAIYGMEAEG